MLGFVNSVADSVRLRIRRPQKYGAQRAEIVTPAKAGVQKSRFQRNWIPACAGMTKSSLSVAILTSGTDGFRGHCWTSQQWHPGGDVPL